MELTKWNAGQARSLLEEKSNSYTESSWILQTWWCHWISWGIFLSRHNWNHYEVNDYYKSENCDKSKATTKLRAMTKSIQMTKICIYFDAFEQRWISIVCPNSVTLVIATICWWRESFTETHLLVPPKALHYVNCMTIPTIGPKFSHQSQHSIARPLNSSKQSRPKVLSKCSPLAAKY